MSAETKTKRNLFEGEVKTCCHYVEFWYDIGTYELTDELKERLTEEAEERAKTCISEMGCESGELNCLYDMEDGRDPEIRGWWSIKRD